MKWLIVQLLLLLLLAPKCVQMFFNCFFSFLCEFPVFFSLFCLFLHASRWKQFNLTALVADESVVVVLCTHRLYLYVGTPQSRPHWHCDKSIKKQTHTHTHTERERGNCYAALYGEIGYKDCHNPIDAIKVDIITIILSVWAGLIYSLLNYSCIYRYIYIYWMFIM